MIIWFVLILSTVGISLAIALYSNFLPYFSILSDIKNYNMAYYGANTTIERSLLVLRYQEAWFQWTWWWDKAWNVYGPVSDSDNNVFSYYSTMNSTLMWAITWRPLLNTIPWINNGMIQWSFLWDRTTNDYNILSYNQPQTIPLWVDNTSDSDAYSGDSSRDYFDGKDIELSLQFTPLVYSWFSEQWLCFTDDNSGDWVKDEVVVDRWWKWTYIDGSSDSVPFSILPRSLVGLLSWGTEIIVQEDDESIRERDINTMFAQGNALIFWEKINPLYGWWLRDSERNKHLMIGSEILSGDEIDQDSFNTLLQNPTVIKDQELNLFLAKHLTTCDGNIYPFLEYLIKFAWDNKISQPYFAVHWKSQVGKYTVNMYLKKSINKKETLNSFTVVF